MSASSVSRTAAAAALNTVDSPLTNTGSGGPGGSLNAQKDAEEASTDAKFGDVWQQIQSKYGAKPEKPREIKKQLGKDDFMRIMITQMKYQDPSQPFKAEQFATELAQFTSVEQLQNLNQAVSKLANQNQPLERMTMTNMIGKTVTVDRDRFAHLDNQADTLKYTLPKNAVSVKIAILSEAGEVMLEKDLGAQKKGENEFIWDGAKNNGLPVKAGNYMQRIVALDDRGQQLPTSGAMTVPVVGVSFEGQEPVFLVGDSARPEKITMKNIVRISVGNESPSGATMIPGAKSLAAAVKESQASGVTAGESKAGTQEEAVPITTGNYFSFQKGVGSKPIDAASLEDQAKAAIANFEEKGFPNGLSELKSEGESPTKTQ